MSAYAKPVEILLIENQSQDIGLIEKMLAGETRPTQLHVVNNPPAAFDYLFHRGDDAAAPRPVLILLDMDIGRQGEEILKQVKSDSHLADIPVVVLASSEKEADILASCQLHANCYIAKPPSPDHRLEVLTSVLRFWLHIARLPCT